MNMIPPGGNTPSLSSNAVFMSDWTPRLLELLRTLSYVEGEVVLASGKVSDFYIDCRQTALHPEGAFLMGRLFHALISRMDRKPDGVGGMTMGADPLVTSTSIASFTAGNPIPAFYIRKEAKGHGLKKYIEGRKNIADGGKVVLLEDVVTTGGSSLKAIERCRDENLEPVALFALVDRLEGGREAIEQVGVPFASIFTRHDFVTKK